MTGKPVGKRNMDASGSDGIAFTATLPHPRFISISLYDMLATSAALLYLKEPTGHFKK